jgi:hypothetical protein
MSDRRILEPPTASAKPTSPHSSAPLRSAQSSERRHRSAPPPTVARFPIPQPLPPATAAADAGYGGGDISRAWALMTTPQLHTCRRAPPPPPAGRAARRRLVPPPPPEAAANAWRRCRQAYRATLVAVGDWRRRCRSCRPAEWPQRPAAEEEEWIAIRSGAGLAASGGIRRRVRAHVAALADHRPFQQRPQCRRECGGRRRSRFVPASGPAGRPAGVLCPGRPRPPSCRLRLRCRRWQ